MSDDKTTIYKNHAGMVERQAMRILRDKHLAQDVCQEVFVRFIEYSAKTKVIDVTGLLFQMATQYAIKRLRIHKNNNHTSTEEVSETGAPQANMEAWIAFRKVLALTGETRAQIAVHYFVDGMSQNEIADLMQKPRREIGRHLERFCAKARKVIGVTGEADLASTEASSLPGARFNR